MTLATIGEADREWARNVGADRPEQAWILSDRDVWYRNPAYGGPPQPHPEDDDIDPEEAAALLAECEAQDARRAAALSDEGMVEDLMGRERLETALAHADPLDPNAYPHLLDPYERELERQARIKHAGRSPYSPASVKQPVPSGPGLYDDDLPF